MSDKQQVWVRVWLVLLVFSGVLTLEILRAHAVERTLTPPPELEATSQPVAMPDFSLRAVNGTTISAADLQGKVVVVRFWATW